MSRTPNDPFIYRGSYHTSSSVCLALSHIEPGYLSAAARRESAVLKNRIFRCHCGKPRSSLGDGGSSSENTVLRIAWYGSELLGITASIFRPAPPQIEIAEIAEDGLDLPDRAQIVEAIKDDFRRSYFVTGQERRSSGADENLKKLQCLEHASLVNTRREEEFFGHATGKRSGNRHLPGVYGNEKSKRRSVGSTSQNPPPEEKISFSSKDMPNYEDPFYNALVIQTAIENFTVSLILVDNGSFVNVIFKKAFDTMKVKTSGWVIVRIFEREEVEGGVELHITLRGGEGFRNYRFVIINAPSSYNATLSAASHHHSISASSSTVREFKFGSEGILRWRRNAM
ncbi:hypothetical protein KSP40_PGU019771 [Platanthera guangdongensis]|uniref:Uncharacterized protein n=1 Tax=Platanthera guangdongensis TaxID=2320717 RepID=A0ABR2MNH8_9ASPA